jgi:hypothetical protein
MFGQIGFANEPNKEDYLDEEAEEDGGDSSGSGTDATDAWSSVEISDYYVDLDEEDKEELSPEIAAFVRKVDDQISQRTGRAGSFSPHQNIVPEQLLLGSSKLWQKRKANLGVRRTQSS